MIGDPKKEKTECCRVLKKEKGKVTAFYATSLQNGMIVRI
jgi:hypothetical protein